MFISAPLNIVSSFRRAFAIISSFSLKLGRQHISLEGAESAGLALSALCALLNLISVAAERSCRSLKKDCSAEVMLLCSTVLDICPIPI